MVILLLGRIGMIDVKGIDVAQLICRRDIPVPGYPEKSRDKKIPGLRNPGISILEKSRDKKSRD